MWAGNIERVVCSWSCWSQLDHFSLLVLPSALMYLSIFVPRQARGRIFFWKGEQIVLKRQDKPRRQESYSRNVLPSGLHQLRTLMGWRWNSIWLVVNFICDCNCLLCVWAVTATQCDVERADWLSNAHVHTNACVRAHTHTHTHTVLKKSPLLQRTHACRNLFSGRLKYSLPMATNSYQSFVGMTMDVM